MRTVITIEAPRSIVWEALADVDSVAVWNPNIDEVECLSEHRRGLGVRRRCFTHPSGWMTEAVTEWEEGTLIAFSVEDAPPLRSGVARFSLSDTDQGTRLVSSFAYRVKLGPLGPVIDRLIVHRQLSSAWQRTVDGLRSYTESQPHAEDTASVIG